MPEYDSSSPKLNTLYLPRDVLHRLGVLMRFNKFSFVPNLTDSIELVKVNLNYNHTITGYHFSFHAKKYMTKTERKHFTPDGDLYGHLHVDIFTGRIDHLNLNGSAAQSLAPATGQERVDSFVDLIQRTGFLYPPALLPQELDKLKQLAECFETGAIGFKEGVPNSLRGSVKIWQSKPADKFFVVYRARIPDPRILSSKSEVEVSYEVSAASGDVISCKQRPPTPNFFAKAPPDADFFFLTSLIKDLEKKG